MIKLWLKRIAITYFALSWLFDQLVYVLIYFGRDYAELWYEPISQIAPVFQVVWYILYYRIGE